MIKQVVSLFGVTEEGDSNQFPFVIPEYEKLAFGKGSNSTCNYLFHKITN